jgi:hypothetical protein
MEEKKMKSALVVITLVFSLATWAQEAMVDVSLTPAGSFKGRTHEVVGFAVRKGAAVEAHNIIVHLKNLKTGIGVRDQHTQKHLETSKFPDAVLVSAKGEGGKGTGVIKIHGVQKEISGKYEIKGKELVAQFPLKLSDFNISGIRYMGVGVDDEVKISVAVPLK